MFRQKPGGIYPSASPVDLKRALGFNNIYDVFAMKNIAFDARGVIYALGLALKPWVREQGKNIYHTLFENGVLAAPHALGLAVDKSLTVEQSLWEIALLLFPGNILAANWTGYRRPNREMRNECPWPEGSGARNAYQSVVFNPQRSPRRNVDMNSIQEYPDEDESPGETRPESYILGGPAPGVIRFSTGTGGTGTAPARARTVAAAANPWTEAAGVGTNPGAYAAVGGGNAQRCDVTAQPSFVFVDQRTSQSLFGGLDESNPFMQGASASSSGGQPFPAPLPQNGFSHATGHATTTTIPTRTEATQYPYDMEPSDKMNISPEEGFAQFVKRGKQG